MKQVGLIVNPIAGMGGAVGLKGTDGTMYRKAVELGAEPVTPERTRILLENISHKKEIHFLVAPGKMGEDHLVDNDYSYEVVGNLPSDGNTNSDDTIRIGHQIVEQGAELIIFVGGDGTARNIYDVVGLELPVVAVPSGVKIFSGVFAVNPIAAAGLVDTFIEGSGFTEEEVLDIDEQAYRDNKLQSQLYGYLRVPQSQGFIQHSKSASSLSGSDIENKHEAAEWFVEKMEADTLYLLGPGTTIQAITEIMGLEKTLLGVDALYDEEILDTDLNENGILSLLSSYRECKIVVTPIGGNGFIFGRGNKQFSPKILQIVGIGNIIVVSTKEKISGLNQLRVDTGDSELDKAFQGYREVIIGYRESRMIKVL